MPGSNQTSIFQMLLTSRQDLPGICNTAVSWRGMCTASPGVKKANRYLLLCCLEHSIVVSFWLAGCCLPATGRASPYVAGCPEAGRQWLATENKS